MFSFQCRNSKLESWTGALAALEGHRLQMADDSLPSEKVDAVGPKCDHTPLLSLSNCCGLGVTILKFQIWTVYKLISQATSNMVWQPVLLWCGLTNKVVKNKKVSIFLQTVCIGHLFEWRWSGLRWPAMQLIHKKPGKKFWLITTNSSSTQCAEHHSFHCCLLKSSYS